MLFKSLCSIVLIATCLARNFSPDHVQYTILKSPVSDSTLINANEDSVERDWENGQIFWKTVIRVSDKDNEFMYYDFETDSISGYLDSATREEYYSRFKQKMDPAELKVHKLVWGLPEVKAQQAGNGGLYTVVTYITDTPDINKPYYDVAIKRLYPGRLGAVIPIPFLHVNLKSGAIEVMEIDGNYISLKKWRKLVK